MMSNYVKPISTALKMESISPAATDADVNAAVRTQSCPEFPAIGPNESPMRSDSDERTVVHPSSHPLLIFTKAALMQSANMSEGSEGSESEGCRVLVVDDNHMNQHLLQAMLSRSAVRHHVCIDWD